MRHAILTLLLLICVVNIVFSQTSNLDIYFKNLLQKADIPGISVAVLDQGKIQYLGALGVRSVDSKLPVSENTIFSAASLSKPVFAYAVLKFADAGKFDLDKPLYEYFPYEDLQHDERYKKITARMILSHTSGLPNWRDGQLQLNFDPGARYSYSGEGFVFLQKVIEKITAKPLDEWMQKQVFQPLGMTRSSYVWQESFENDYALPHDEDMKSRQFNKYENGNTAYSLLTTAQDYGKFLLEVLQMQTAKKSNFNQMLQPRLYVTEKWGQESPTRKDIAWGLGLGLEYNANGQYFWQWGDNGTFKAFVIGNKATGKGLVYFTNGSNGLSITAEVLQKVFGDTHTIFNWLNYVPYDAPARQLYKAILNQGFTKATEGLLTEAGTLKDTLAYTENAINSLGYRLSRQKRTWEAQQILAVNMRTFPYSSNVYDSYAEISMYAGDHKAAIKACRKLLELNPENKLAQNVLDQLTKPLSGKVKIELRGYDNAKFVSLAGSFNDWSQWHHIMQRQDGAWVCQLDLEPGTYEYKFVVDGIWILDETNPKTVYENGHHNSVLEIK